jgi:hypothetical protein
MLPGELSWTFLTSQTGGSSLARSELTSALFRMAAISSQSNHPGKAGCRKSSKPEKEGDK